MKNITLALAIALGFCATETFAQARGEPQASPEEIQERQLWSTWPKDVHYLDANIVKACEQALNVVFNSVDNDGWVQGCGKCLIDRESGRGLRQRDGDYFWKKFNSEGVLVQSGKCAGFKEYVWMTNCAACVTLELRKQWAKENGMTYEDAVRKRELKEKENKNMGRERERAFVAKCEAEREKVHEELRKQSLKIQESLRKVCGAAEKAKEEE